MCSRSRQDEQAPRLKSESCLPSQQNVEEGPGLFLRSSWSWEEGLCERKEMVTSERHVSAWFSGLGSLLDRWRSCFSRADVLEQMLNCW